MKRAFALLISILLLFISCDGENLWQKLSIAKKPELKITTPGIKEVQAIDNKVELMSIFTQSSNLTFNIEIEEFTGKIIKPQTKSELNTMVELLLSKVFSKDEVRTYLNSSINNEEIEEALKGNAQLLQAMQNSLITIINIPEITIKNEAELIEYLKSEGMEATPENIEKVSKTIKEWNLYIKDVNDNLKEFIEDLFVPLKNFIEKPCYSWSDYTRIQLTTNIVGNLLRAISKSFSEGSFDINTSNIDDFFNTLQNESIKNIYLLALNLIGELVNPLAGMNQIASFYGDIIQMPEIKEIINLFMEEKR